MPGRLVPVPCEVCQAARVLCLGVAAAVAAAAWLYLLVGHGGYWRTDQRLPGRRPAADRPRCWPCVTAVVPSRDEADMLPVTLPTLLTQDYPGSFQVVVVDDASSDGTAAVADTVGRDAPRSPRVIRGAPPPPGWAGKVWAMAQGVAGAGPDAAGPADYLLFTDADIAWSPGALRDLVEAAERDDRDLVSQMALLRATTRWERLIIPAFVYFFAQLYPFRRVNRPAARTAAAAGGCMLVRRRALEAAGGLAPIRAALIDDVALGRLLKRPPSRGRCWLGLSTGVRSVRPYARLADLWSMVTRSAYTQLRYSPAVLIATLLGLVWCYLVPPAGAIAGVVALAVGDGSGAVLAAAAGVAGWALMTVSYLPMLRFYRLSPLRAPLLPLAAATYAAMTADSARRHHAGRGGAWKGRTHVRSS